MIRRNDQTREECILFVTFAALHFTVKRTYKGLTIKGDLSVWEWFSRPGNASAI